MKNLLFTFIYYIRGRGERGANIFDHEITFPTRWKSFYLIQTVLLCRPVRARVLHRFYCNRFQWMHKLSIDLLGDVHTRKLVNSCMFLILETTHSMDQVFLSLYRQVFFTYLNRGIRPLAKCFVNRKE